MRNFDGVSGAGGDGLAKLTPAPATRWTPEVANAIVLEIANVITHEDGGDTPLDPGDNAQLRAAIIAIANRASAATYGSNVAGHWRKTPDGEGGFLIEQWGVAYSGNDGFSGDYEFPIPFTVGVEHMTVDARTGNISAANGNDHFIDVSAFTPLTHFRVGTTDAAQACWWSAKGR